MNNYLNVINFVRASKRAKGKEDELIKTLREEIKLCKMYHFPNTFLLQYDVLVKEDFLKIFKEEEDENRELGVWLEIVKPLVERVGIEWRGREGHDWDWHVNPGFLIAYEREQRELLCDEVMNKFKEIFGCYPKCVGSWMIDSYSMEYMSKKYDIRAFCICKEQYGVDGYSFWGGYYNQGYYPSKYNMLCPAQSQECQINVPVFRMLGIDPMYEYDNKRYETRWGNIYKQYPIYSFEPALGAGRDRNYAKWMLETYGSDKTVNYSYIQHGQENSFCWEALEEGWNMQSELLDGLIKEKKLIPLKMSEMGDWFKGNFKETPPTSMVAETDWSDHGLKSFWYNCKNYRTNIFVDAETLIIRDIYKFNENYKERYYDDICVSDTSLYDNLPVMDGVLWSDGEIRSGLFLKGNVSDVNIDKEDNKQIICVKVKEEKVKIILSEEKIEIFGNARLDFRRKSDIDTEIELKNEGILYNHNSFEYFVPIEGAIEKADNGFVINPLHNKIVIKMKD